MIKFESEKAFEHMLVEHMSGGIDPIHEEKVLWVKEQVRLGSFGICDVLALTEFKFKNNEKNHALHLIELKINPVTSMQIAQVCRYKKFFEEIDALDKLNISDIRYSLINSYSAPCDDVIHLAQSCGVDIYYYSMGMNGISFKTYQEPSSDAELVEKDASNIKSILFSAIAEDFF